MYYILQVISLCRQESISAREVEETWHKLCNKNDAGKGLTSESQRGSMCWISVAENKKNL